MSKHAIGKKFHSQNKFIDTALFPEAQRNGTKNYIIHLPCPVPQHYRVFSQGNIGGVPIGRGWR